MKVKLKLINHYMWRIFSLNYAPLILLPHGWSGLKVLSIETDPAVKRGVIKGWVADIFANSSRSGSSERPLNFACANLSTIWQFQMQLVLANSHTAPAAAFLLNHTRVGKGAMNKFWASPLGLSEHFYIRYVYINWEVAQGSIQAFGTSVAP